MRTWKVMAGGLLAVALVIGLAACDSGKDKPAAPSMSAPAEQTVEMSAGPQTVCPVMGGKVNKDLYVDYEGKRIYVCCEGCIAAVKKNPQKYVSMMEAAGVTLDKAPTP